MSLETQHSQFFPFCFGIVTINLLCHDNVNQFDQILPTFLLQQQYKSLARSNLTKNALGINSLFIYMYSNFTVQFKLRDCNQPIV